MIRMCICWNINLYIYMSCYIHVLQPCVPKKYNITIYPYLAPNKKTKPAENPQRRQVSCSRCQSRFFQGCFLRFARPRRASFPPRSNLTSFRAKLYLGVDLHTLGSGLGTKLVAWNHCRRVKQASMNVLKFIGMKSIPRFCLKPELGQTPNCQITFGEVSPPEPWF